MLKYSHTMKNLTPTEALAVILPVLILALAAARLLQKPCCTRRRKNRYACWWETE